VVHEQTARLAVLQPAWVLAAGSAQPPTPTSKEAEGIRVLERVADTYRRLRTFRSTALMRTTTPRNPHGGAVLVITAFKRPARSRLRVDGEGPMKYVDIQNGDSLWHYMPDRKQYCSPGRIRNWHPQQAPFIVTEGLAYEKITRGLNAAKVLGKVRLNVNSRPVMATVVRASYAPLKAILGRIEPVLPNVYWIDTDTGIVLQHSYQTRMPASASNNLEVHTTTVSVILYQTDVAIPDRVFNFSRPIGVVSETTCLELSGGG
jgi:outer membrane lipoprotein-sorting protein